MKIYLDKVFKIDEDYQEILIEKSGFGVIKQLQVFPIRQNINGLTYDDIIPLEPHCCYEIKLKKNTPSDFKKFMPNFRLLRAGLIISDINKETGSIFVYNATNNNIFVRPNAIIGEIE